jgi:two-component system cell cycle sensor histidine kinase/response regulator CckA
VQAATATMLEHKLREMGRSIADTPHPGNIEQPSLPARDAGTFDLGCTHDFEGRILSINPATCEALGLPAASIRGMTIPELLPPEAAYGIAKYLQTLRSEGFAIAMMKIEGCDGSWRIWECRGTVVADGIVRGVGRDVTGREEVFRRARRSEEHFRSIIENVSDIIAIIELNGRFRYGSPSVSRVLGYPRAFLTSVAAIDIIHPDDVARASAFLASKIADPAAIQSIELRVRHQEGAWRSFEIVATSLIKNGRTSGVVINARDITERKLLEAQLVQANRLGGLGRLAATVAHEFNNVLMGMQPFAELMQRPDATPEIISKGTWHISNSIQRGKRIVLEILRFAQPHLPVTTAIDLGEWWKTFAPEAEAVLGNVISLVSEIPDSGLCVMADRGQLSQVLANLVANARDAMPAGGSLTVNAKALQPDARFPFGAVPHPERFVEISICDTGRGMAAEVMDRVFEPLFTTKQSGGTGLGLAVAHQVITQHGGYIFVDSEPDHGSNFHLFLPRGTLPPTVSAIAPPSRIVTARKVLIIDDEESIVEGIAALLEQEGIAVETVGTGAEALGAIASFHPHIVVLDFGLPDMDGGEVYTRIRELHPLLPVIFATGHGDRRVLLDEVDDPRARFLQKPFDIALLLETMAELETENKAPR